MKIEKGKRVRMKIHLAVKDGDTLEKSVVEYFQGAGTMLTGLESELAGLEEGAKKEGTIPAKAAFGAEEHRHPKVISKNEFPDGAEFEVGQQFEAKGADGNPVILRVEKITDENVECVLLHPLHDKDISFEAEILAVTDPTPPPLPAEAVTSDS